jgi:hypothetical protein
MEDYEAGLSTSVATVDKHDPAKAWNAHRANLKVGGIDSESDNNDILRYSVL